MSKDFSSDFKDYERGHLPQPLYLAEVAAVSLNVYFSSPLVSETSRLLYRLLNEKPLRSYWIQGLFDGREEAHQYSCDS
jgi:hypothetical protein